MDTPRHAVSAVLLILFSLAGLTIPRVAPPSTGLAAQNSAPDIFTLIREGRADSLGSLLKRSPALANKVQVEAVATWAQMESADPWEPEFQGKITPLVAAIMAGREDMVKLLLDAGARTETYVVFQGVKDPGLGMWESNALFAAVEAGNPHMVKLLLDAGADPAQRVRYFGGPTPPIPPSTEPDLSIFGAAYYKDSRARVGIMDLLMVPGFRNATMVRMIQRANPRLRAEYHRESPYWAAVRGDAESLGALLARGDVLDRDGLGLLARKGMAGSLALAAGTMGLDFGHRFSTEELGNLARVCMVLDEWWYRELAGRPRAELMLDPARLAGFQDAVLAELRGTAIPAGGPGRPVGLDLARAMDTLGRFGKVWSTLPRPASPMAGPGYRLSDTAWPAEALLLLEPWTQPWQRTAREGPGKGLASAAMDALLAASVRGTWRIRSPQPWRIIFEPGQIRSTGITAFDHEFDSHFSPWSISASRSLTVGGRRLWQVRAGEVPGAWIFARPLDDGSLMVYDPVEETTLGFQWIP